MSKSPFSATVAREWLSYEPDTGVITWIKGRKSGRVAGSYDGRGYIQIRILGGMLKAHRLAWLLAHGEWPDGVIDHINHKTDDNRIENLRCVSTSENIQNQIRGMKNSSHGFLGVKARKDGRYESRICVNGKRIALGTFGSPEDAHSAYVSAKRVMHLGCTI